MAKCPSCGSREYTIKNNKCICDYCGAKFDDNASEPLINIRKNSLKRGNTHWKNPAEFVYEKCINGVAIIDCDGWQGTGFLVNDYELVTNAHVVSEEGDIFENITCIIAGEKIKARVTKIGDEDNYDLALLRLEKRCKGTPLKLGKSASLRVGQNIIVIGNSNAEGLRITTGIISDKRVYNSINAIMFDASICGGNSGGPIFNEDAEVVGVVCWGKEDDGLLMNYAIPIDETKILLKI